LWKEPGVQDNIAREIELLRDRLAEIEDERSHLDDADQTRREELLAEERRLEVRLAEVEERLSDERGVAEEKLSHQTDLTRTPRLPESEDRS
jgi:predicted  nucleic acid-binding Zn-ribbon protein